jgi:hypothetical protein
VLAQTFFRPHILLPGNDEKGFRSLRAASNLHYNPDGGGSCDILRGGRRGLIISRNC